MVLQRRPSLWVLALTAALGGCASPGSSSSVDPSDVADVADADGETAPEIGEPEPVDDADTGHAADVADATGSEGLDGAGDVAPDTSTPDAGPPPGSDPAECRLGFSGGGVAVGFPRPAARLKTVGAVKATVLFTDFADVTADMTPQAVQDILSPGAEAFFSTVSYGAMELVLEPHLVWLRLSGPASQYAEGIKTFAGHRAFLAEAVELADPAVDFSETDVVVVMSAPNASVIGYGPTWMGNEGAPLVADGNAITNGITSGADLIGWGSKWLNHEMGHSMSLPDLYSYGGAGGYTRPFSLMDDIGSSAPELLAWERWQLDWLTDEQIVCNPTVTEVTLRPLATAGGLKAVMVRLSEHRVVVAESRRALGYDSGLAAPGLVVSVVDGAIATGHGPISVVNDKSALAVGESVTVDGVTLTLLSSGEDGDVVGIDAPSTR